jgi:hypothetical protein
MILRISDKNGRSKDDENTHPVLGMVRQTDAVLSDVWRDTSLESWLTNEIDGRTVGLTPDLSENVDNVIQEAILPFTLEELLEKHNTGAKTGSANVTAIHVLYEMSIRESMTHLAETGQLDKAVKVFEGLVTDKDPSPETCVAYAIFTYAKGWVAEQIITDDERFSKLWITNDQYGQDVRFKPDSDEKQIKPVTAYARGSKRTFKRKDTPHWFYQWTGDGLVLADLDDANDANAIAAKEADMWKTILKKSENQGILNGYHRPARVLWW